MRSLADAARFLASVFARAADAWSDPALTRALFRDLGWELASLPPEIAAVGDALAAVDTLWRDLEHADPSEAQVAPIASAIGGLWHAFQTLETTPPPSGLPAAFAEGLATTLLDYWVIDALHHLGDIMLPALELLGIVEIRYVEEALPRQRYFLRRVHWELLPKLLADPGAAFRARWGWGTAAFDAPAMLARFRDMIAALPWPASLRTAPRDEMLAAGDATTEDALCVDVELLAGEVAGTKVAAGVRLLPIAPPGRSPGLALVPYLDGELGDTIAITDRVSLTIDASFDLEGGVVVTWIPERGVEVKLGLGAAAVTGASGRGSFTFDVHDPTRSPRVLFDALGVRLTAATAIGLAQIQLGSSSSFSVEISLADGVLTWDPSQAPGVLARVLGDHQVTTAAPLGLGWSSTAGFYVRGGSALGAAIPTTWQLGPVAITGLRVAVAGVPSGIALSLGVDGRVKLGPVTIAWQGLGAALVLSKPATGSLPLALDVDANAPSAISIGVASPLVSGSGSIQRQDADLDRYAGALHVKIADTIDLAAWGVLHTGSATQHRSLVVILAGHISPVELGWNFRLTGLGGLLALHRRMDVDALRDAAYGVTGCLDDLLFPDSPETRFPQLLATIDRFFPPATGSHVAGPMVEIEWGRGAVVNARIRATLLLQLDGSKVALYGTVRVGFPTIDSDSTLRIRAGLEALFDPRDKLARFSITILEAKLFQSIQFTGGAAFLVRWGSGREFAFTIGGFHPAFRPYIPAGLIEPPRVGVHWNPLSGVRLDLTQYFAITSTSMQFGAAAHAEVRVSWGKVTGELAFDVLVMTSPSLFLEADLHARVTVSVFGADLLSAGLDGSLVGPGPWVFSGKVEWKVWIVGISKSFHFEWGDRLSIPAAPQSAGAILGAEMQLPANWTSFRTRRLPVKVRSGVTAPLAPPDEIEVRQSRLPFDTPIETLEGNPLSDAGLWTLTVTSASGIVKLFDLTAVFPERRFLAHPSKERPFRSGLHCGAHLARPDWDISAVAINVDSTATDDVVIDGGATVTGAVALPAPRVADGVASALPATGRARGFGDGATLELAR